MAVVLKNTLDVLYRFIIPTEADTSIQKLVKPVALIASSILAGRGTYQLGTNSFSKSYPWFLGSFIPLVISFVTSYYSRSTPSSPIPPSSTTSSSSSSSSSSSASSRPVPSTPPASTSFAAAASSSSSATTVSSSSASASPTSHSASSSTSSSSSSASSSSSSSSAPSHPISSFASSSSVTSITGSACLICMPEHDKKITDLSQLSPKERLIQMKAMGLSLFESGTRQYAMKNQTACNYNDVTFGIFFIQQEQIDSSLIDSSMVIGSARKQLKSASGVNDLIETVSSAFPEIEQIQETTDLLFDENGKMLPNMEQNFIVHQIQNKTTYHDILQHIQQNTPSNERSAFVATKGAHSFMIGYNANSKEFVIFDSHGTDHFIHPIGALVAVCTDINLAAEFLSQLLPATIVKDADDYEDVQESAYDQFYAYRIQPIHLLVKKQALEQARKILQE